MLRLLLATVCLFTASLGEGAIRTERLRCEHRIDPLGVDVAEPRLSWIVTSNDRAQTQSAYRVLVASSPELLEAGKADRWDSGRVESSDTLAIRYAGEPLTTHDACYWTVRVWDGDGEASDWSAPARWSVGFLGDDKFNAEWIGHDDDRGDDPITPTALLRAEFSLDKPIKRAIAYVTCLGLCDVWLNGQRMTDDYFLPGWTDYNRRVYYRAYDVTDLVNEGENACGVELANGWYAGYAGLPKKVRYHHYGKRPRFAGQLRVEYEDGSTQTLATGDGWTASTGGTMRADLLRGEKHDSRRAPEGWAEVGFDDTDWSSVDRGAEVDPAIEWHPAQPVVEVGVFAPVEVTEPKPGVYVLDLGQNFAGVPRLRIEGEPGQKITLRHAERLNPDGAIYLENLRTADPTDEYVCRGEGVEVWQPRFTFHGFQYVEVTGLGHKPAGEEVVGVALSSDTPIVSDFDCPDPMLNQLVNNTFWTQRANFIDIPTDCPQRDERLGWTGDAQVYIETATRHTDVQAFFTKWLVDLTDAQRDDGQFPRFAPRIGPDQELDGGSAWADAGVICPWELYQTYGDRALLERQYPSMKRFVEFMRGRSKEGVLPPDEYHTFGDWLSIEADTPKDVLYTAYHACSTRRLAQAAEVLGEDADAQEYQALYERIKQAFNDTYIDEEGRVEGDTQCGYVLAIVNDLVEGERLDQAAAHLAADIEERGHLSTGFIGTKDLMLVLSKIDRNDLAFKLLHNDTFPSWGFSIKHGATSIWERWNGWTPEVGFFNPGMNSFAHYSFGAVYGWMVRTLGGIEPLEPGFGRLRIAPKIDPNLRYCQLGYDSVRGLIGTHWSLEDGVLTTRLTVPANTIAEVELPCDDASQVTETGDPLSEAAGVSQITAAPGVVRFNLGSGEYDFTTPYRGHIASE